MRPTIHFQCVLADDRMEACLGFYGGDYRNELHEHENPYISFVIAGGHAELMSKNLFECGPGAFSFHPAGDWHRNVFYHDGLEELSVLIRPEWFRSLQEICGPLATRWDLQCDRLKSLGMRLRQELLHPVHDSPEVVKDLVESSLRILSRRETSAWTNAVDERLRSSLSEKIDLEYLANQAGFHRAHVAKAYRTRYGRTLAEAHRAYRIEKARMLLGQADRQIGQIAAECGFSDHSHFNRWFRRFAGVTPRQYRTWYREKVLTAF